MQHVALSPHHIVLGCNEDHARLRFDPFEGSSRAQDSITGRNLQLLPPPSQQQQREGLNGMDGTLPPK